MSDMPSVIGAYAIVRELGRGAMGVVYLARRDDLDRAFAVKVLATGDEWAAEATERFQREARLAAALAGTPGLVAVHDTGVHDGRPYLVMDFIDGRPLDVVIGEEPLAPTIAARYIAAAARAIATAHDAGILHRDLKPSNLLIDRADDIWVTDFGLARRSVADDALQRLTRTGEVLGTPAFMAPEQARGESVDGRADVYALGATLFELVTGRLPFEGPDVMQVITGVLRTPAPPARRFTPQLPRALDTIIATCLAKSPAARYPSALALAEDLDRFLAGTPIAARPGRHSVARIVAAVALAAAVLVAVGLGAWTTLFPTTSPATTAAAEVRTLAAEIDAAYIALAQTTDAPLRLLEDRWRGIPHTPAARAEAIATIDAAVAKAALAYPRARVPAAWALVARWYDDPEATDPALVALAESEYIDPLPALLLARLRLARWGRGLSGSLVGVGVRARVQAFEESAAMKQDRTAAEVWLTRARTCRVWSTLERSQPLLRFVEAVHAAGTGDLAGAVATLDGLAVDPIVGPDAALSRAGLLMRLRRFEEAAQSAEQAAQRRWPRALLDAAGARFAAALDAHEDGRDARTHLTAAQAHFDAACAARSAPWMCFQLRGMFRWRRSEILPLGPAQRDADLAGAVEDFTHAAELAPDPVPAWHLRARVWTLIGTLRRVHGGDTAEANRHALADAARVLDVRPDYVATWSVQDEVARVEAQRLARTGGDPLPMFQLSARSLAEWRTRTPMSEIDAREVQLHTYWARWIGLQRGDPTAQLERGRDAADRLAEAEPNHRRTHRLRGLLFDMWARFARGGAAAREPRFAQALEAYSAGLALFPDDPELLTLRGGTQVNYAFLHQNQGLARGGELLRAALADLDAALEADPEAPNALDFRASARCNYARWLAKQGGAWESMFASGIDDYRRLTARAPGTTLPWVHLASGLLDIGRFRIRDGQSARPAVTAAVDDLTRALAVAPNNADLLHTRGTAYNALRQVQRREGDTADAIAATARLAIADLTAAVAADPRMAPKVRTALASCRADAGE